MIITLPHTSTREVTQRLNKAREERGEVASGRVLTVVVSSTAATPLESILVPVTDAAREHPARVIILQEADGPSDEPRLDAQIHLGGKAGASEIIVLSLHGGLTEHEDSIVRPLQLPDTPIVVWWPGDAPRNPAADPLGVLADRRITDVNAETTTRSIYRRRTTYSRGDSDLGWSRITLWRALLASTLDQPPFEPVESAEVTGPADDAAVDLAAGWLADQLAVPVKRINSDAPVPPVDAAGHETVPVQKTVLNRAGADITVAVQDAHTAEVTVGTRRSLVALAPRDLGDCLAEELRHLDSDYAFGRALRGLVRVNRPRRSGETVTRIVEDLESLESQR